MLSKLLRPVSTGLLFLDNVPERAANAIRISDLDFMITAAFMSFEELITGKTIDADAGFRISHDFLHVARRKTLLSLVISDINRFQWIFQYIGQLLENYEQAFGKPHPLKDKHYKLYEKCTFEFDESNPKAPLFPKTARTYCLPPTFLLTVNNTPIIVDAYTHDSVNNPGICSDGSRINNPVEFKNLDVVTSYRVMYQYCVPQFLHPSEWLGEVKPSWWQDHYSGMNHIQQINRAV